MARRYSISWLFGMVEPDAEDVGVGELVDALVELAEDRVEVERRGDLAADLAQQLDVLLALALGPAPAPRRPRRAAAPRRTARARAPWRSRAGAARGRRPAKPSRPSSQVAGVRPPRAVPRRQDGERVDRLPRSPAPARCARATRNVVVAEAEVRVVATRLAASMPTSRRRGRRAAIWYCVALSSRNVGAANSNRNALDAAASRVSAGIARASGEECPIVHAADFANEHRETDGGVSLA